MTTEETTSVIEMSPESTSPCTENESVTQEAEIHSMTIQAYIGYLFLFLPLLLPAVAGGFGEIPQEFAYMCVFIPFVLLPAFVWFFLPIPIAYLFLFGRMALRGTFMAENGKLFVLLFGLIILYLILIVHRFVERNVWSQTTHICLSLFFLGYILFFGDSLCRDLWAGGHTRKTIKIVAAIFVLITLLAGIGLITFMRNRTFAF